MSTQTTNYNFDLREGTDIFNPLSTNANWESLDTILKNLQENGGITTYTTTAAANLLKLSGTPKVNDTVFKFVAAGDANTWTGATGGVINNIVSLDGKQVTIKGGNMYVAWVNSANAMVVVAWPAAVDAKTFDGRGPDDWATKAQLDTVNQTAANATQTAQAATTVANNALEVAQNAGGVKWTWNNNNPDADFSSSSVVVNIPKEAKSLVIAFRTIASVHTENIMEFGIGESDTIGCLFSVSGGLGSITNANFIFAARKFTCSLSEGEIANVNFSNGYNITSVYSSGTSGDISTSRCVPTKIGYR